MKNDGYSSVRLSTTQLGLLNGGGLYFQRGTPAQTVAGQGTQHDVKRAPNPPCDPELALTVRLTGYGVSKATLYGRTVLLKYYSKRVRVPILLRAYSCS